MFENTHFLFDVDSTVISHESLQDMVLESIAENPDPSMRKQKTKELLSITNAGMNGEIDFQESVEKRLALSDVRLWHMERVIEKMKGSITEGMPDLMEELQGRGANVWLLTAGLEEMMLPLAKKLRILASHVLANRGMWDTDRLVCLAPSPLLRTNGKARVIQQLRKDGALQGRVTMIGDGMSDLNTFLLGAADDFFGFGEHAVRPNVLAMSPHFFRSVAEVRIFLRI